MLKYATMFFFFVCFIRGQSENMQLWSRAFVKNSGAKKGLQQDLLPNSYPEYQPVEQAFNFVSSYVKKKANTYAPLGTWQEADLWNVIKEAISQIDHMMLKS
jgi:hypothetical protein